MKTYLTTVENPNGFYDPARNFGFNVGSPHHDNMVSEVVEGKARVEVWVDTVADKRKRAYAQAGLTADGWLEAIVESIGSSEAGFRSDKFIDLWEKRQAIRAKYPKK